MPTTEKTFLPLFSKTQEVNRQLKKVAVFQPALTHTIRQELVALSTEVGLLGGVDAMTQAFANLANTVAQTMFEVQDPLRFRELARLHNLLHEFTTPFVEAPSDWRRGMAFGIINSLAEPLTTREPLGIASPPAIVHSPAPDAKPETSVTKTRRPILNSPSKWFSSPRPAQLLKTDLLITQ